MTNVAVLRLPLAVDLSGFVKLLQRMQVPHRVSEEAGEQVLWVPANISEDVRVLYERYPAGDPDQQLAIPVARTVRGRASPRSFGTQKARRWYCCSACSSVS
jgi:GlpG protein